VRLLHARAPVDALVESSWERREAALREFAQNEARIWDDTAPVVGFDHTRLLEWMKSPKSQKVRRYYAQWGIDDVFSAITRKAQKRADLWLKINELVEKRNNIAHGDLTAEATYLDVQRYLAATKLFVGRADRLLGTVVSRLDGAATPWP
jgi:hypothetical protein